MGAAKVRMPLGVTSVLEFETDIVLQDVPLMFGLDQHRRHGCNSDENHNTFTHHPSNTTIPLKFKKGHLYVEWPTAEVVFTRMELKKLHERFGHPTSMDIINLLERARPKNCDTETQREHSPLVSICKTCQTFAPKPIEVDLFWLE